MNFLKRIFFVEHSFFDSVIGDKLAVGNFEGSERFEFFEFANLEEVLKNYFEDTS